MLCVVQIAHDVLSTVLELFPLVNSVNANLAFFEQLNRAFREEKWRSFNKGVTQAIKSLEQLYRRAVTSASDGVGDVEEDRGDERTSRKRQRVDTLADFPSQLAELKSKAHKFSQQADESGHPFAFAFTEGLLVQVRSVWFAGPLQRLLR
jgi:hypothetical protein